MSSTEVIANIDRPDRGFGGGTASRAIRNTGISPIKAYALTR
jgi:hypothetical protein